MAAGPGAGCQAVRKTVPNQLHAIGTVEAYSTVSVKSQIDGKIVAGPFQGRTGREQGRPAVHDRSAPVRGAITSGPGQSRPRPSAASGPMMKSATIPAEGGRRLARAIRPGPGVRRRRCEPRSTADQAAEQTARLNLEYTEIPSPIDGRTGNLMLHPGNLVKANADTRDGRDQSDQADLRGLSTSPKRSCAGPPRHGRRISSPCRCGPGAASDRRLRSSGMLSFVDNTVDADHRHHSAQGAIRQQDQRLWPGQFVDVTLTLSERPDTMLVPSPGDANWTGGSFVFVVEPDMKGQGAPGGRGRHRSRARRSSRAASRAAKPWSPTANCGWFRAPR